MIRTIVIDLDGTLLNSRKEIDPATAEAIKTFVKNGGTLVIASGRHYNEMSCYMDAIGKCYVICCDGAYIYDPDGTLLYTATGLRGENVRDIIGWFHPGRLSFYTYDTDVLIFRWAWMRMLYRALLLLKGRTPKRKYSVQSYRFDGRRYPYIEKISIKRKFNQNDMAVLKEHFTVHTGLDGATELLYKGVNKYTALQVLEERGCIKTSESLYFGDDHNDMECFADLPYTVAMGNAANEIKQAAKYVTKTNDENGVLAVIHKINESKHEPTI